MLRKVLGVIGLSCIRHNDASTLQSAAQHVATLCNKVPGCPASNTSALRCACSGDAGIGYNEGLNLSRTHIGTRSALDAFRQETDLMFTVTLTAVEQTTERASHPSKLDEPGLGAR